MADNVWDNSDGDNDGNVAANWSLGNVPTGTDVAVFDSATTSDACTFSGNLSCQGMRFDNTYAGTVDAATYNITLGSDGLDCTGGGSATLDLGSGTWEIAGNCDLADIGTLDDGSSTIKMTGTSKTLTIGDNVAVYNIVIASGASITLASEGAARLNLDGTLTVEATATCNDSGLTSCIDGGTAWTINGTLTLDAYWASANAIESSTLTVGSSGKITGTATLQTLRTTGVSIAAGGVIDIASMTMKYNLVAQTLPVFVFSGTGTLTYEGTRTNAHTLTFASGTVSCLSGNLAIKGNTNASYANDTNDPDFAIGGDLSIDASMAAYTAGAGTITLSGGDDADVNCNGESVEDIVIDKDSSADKVTLTGDVTTDSLTLTAGTLEINGYDLDVSGNLSMAAGTTLLDTDTGGSVSIGGNLDINGTSGSGCTWTDADIDTLTGTGDADYCTVTDSNNSSGTTIDATDNCTDGTGNTGWNFGAVAAIAKLVYGKLVNCGTLISGALAK